MAGRLVICRCGTQLVSRDVLRCEAVSNVGILAFTGDWDKRNCPKILVGRASEAVQRTVPPDFADFRPLERRVEGDAAPDFGARRWQQPHQMRVVGHDGLRTVQQIATVSEFHGGRCGR